MTDTAPAPPEDAPLSAKGWLSQNGVLLLLLALLGAFIFRQVGIEGLPAVAWATLGLGFLIFIHELGHFLAAKACDVHVKTFSIGFGPAIPGCRFTLGETTYMIGVLPLGGYVYMVGEGTDEEDGLDPRSTKAKSVFQRMFIISAGVIMNVLFAIAAFVVVYRVHGVDRPPATVWRTEPGSRAWEQGVKAGWRITRIDGRQDPYFDDLKYAVSTSAGGTVMAFEFTDRDGNTHDLGLEPYKDENGKMPSIGVHMASRLKLVPEQFKAIRSAPVRYNSAAASARVLPLERGDVVLAIDGRPVGKDPWAELSQRLREADEKAVELRVRRAGGKEEGVTLAAEGFAFGDAVVGTTDPKTPDDPLNVSPIPPDASQDPKRGLCDPFEFRRRTVALVGKPCVYEVRRAGGEGVKVLVPPAYHFDLGARMKMGKVVSVRTGPASESGLKKDDEIVKVGLKYRDEKPVEIEHFDPVRLPDELHRRVHADPNRSPSDFAVVFTVLVVKDHGRGERELTPIRWDESFGLDDEAPVSASSPMSVPQVGVAYLVESTIVEVKEGSPAARAGLKARDEVVGVRVRTAGKTPDKEEWGKWREVSSKRGKTGDVYDQWAHYHWALQENDVATVEFRVKREGELLMKPGEALGWWDWFQGKKPTPETFGPIEAEPDVTWARPDRGLMLFVDMRRQKAETLTQAVGLGLERSFDFARTILLNLRSLFTGRTSVENIGGPIEIARQAFTFASEDWYTFAQWLAIISINLAVMNFLPIPVLDGGHMVFLLYEWVRGKPPSETVQSVATIIGVVLLLSLMVFVSYLDIFRAFGLSGWSR